MVEPVLFLRLLGMAYASLLVGYLFGVFSKSYPVATVTVGVVSNGGACVILWVFRSSWSGWPSPAGPFMSFSLFATGAITCALLVSAARYRWAHAAPRS